MTSVLTSAQQEALVESITQEQVARHLAHPNTGFDYHGIARQFVDTQSIEMGEVPIYDRDIVRQNHRTLKLTPVEVWCA